LCPIDGLLAKGTSRFLKLHANIGELVNFLGRQSFRLARGLANTQYAKFQNGTIDVDIAAEVLQVIGN
jgi:hypothetical protein